ncbi:MAG: hypothetical protein PHY27_12990 [Parabacteroides sp.]|jgi:periplasmic protein CpxP/Spy|uniref:Periplasmic heavy metal sensor n=2 Tax=Macellibacteroides TaxID=1159323 RepID=A0A8E2A218_9PORP|nr:hypothetical protein [Macellibacteroides fermentans]MBP7919906.1 hypothetical protein [Parabacteroides sp.]MBP7938969.1 hypothetical protein [Parabacteroides sp.]MBP8011482.1 hypothetical protein [Parabacteroides sp.]MBP8025883.1 hypothetical protein [Parabacteroides sp.]MDD3509327.1 hypothetical protein [Parabacteroides sp.]
MKKLIGLFLILFLSSTVLIAQENRTARRGADMKAMQERMISELKLDEKQAAEYQKISDEFRSKMQSEREKMGGDRQAMFEKMKTLRAERDEKLKAVLSEEQFKQLQEKEKQMQGNRGPRGGR